MGSSSESLSDKLKEVLLSYIESHNTMTIATSHNNIPWTATVFYANVGFKLFYLSDPDARHSIELAENSTIAGTIYEDYYDYRKIKGIQMEATVDLVSSEDEMVEVIKTYIEKYPYVSAYLKLMMTPFPKVMGILEKAISKLPVVPDFNTPFPAKFYKVIPHKIYWIDNETSFGKRKEIIL
jgi:uncharacterized protein YhbP (UPF0306 family)